MCAWTQCKQMDWRAGVIVTTWTRRAVMLLITSRTMKLIMAMLKISIAASFPSGRLDKAAGLTCYFFECGVLNLRVGLESFGVAFQCQQQALELRHSLRVMLLCKQCSL